MTESRCGLVCIEVQTGLFDLDRSMHKIVWSGWKCTAGLTGLDGSEMVCLGRNYIGLFGLYKMVCLVWSVQHRGISLYVGVQKKVIALDKKCTLDGLVWLEMYSILSNARKCTTDGMTYTWRGIFVCI